MYNAAASIRSIRQFKRHEEELDKLIENYSTYVQKLFAIRTKRDAQQFADEIASLASIVHRWNFDPVRHRCIRRKIEYVKRLETGLEERAQQLKLGEIKGTDLRRLYPTLAELAEEYSQELVVSSHKDREVDAQETKKEQARQEPETDIATGNKCGANEAQQLQKTGHLQNEQETAAGEVRKPKAQPLEIIASASPTIDLRDVGKFFDYHITVGENDTRLISTLGAIKQLSFGFISLSGSGKSKVTYMLKKLLPDGTMYVMELSSETAEAYEADQINRHRIIFLPELQKALESGHQIIREILKNVTEGRDGKRKVRNHAKGVNDEYTIRGDLGVIFAMTPDHKIDMEFLRRVFVLQTDISPEQTERVVYSIAEQAHAQNRRREKMFPEVRSHVGDCLELNGSIEYEVPCPRYIAGFIPKKTVRARSYVNYLFDMINASAQFHHGNRVFSDNILFANLTDIHLVMEKLFWKHYMKGLLGIPIAGEETLRIFQENPEGLTRNEAYTRLNDINCDIDERVADSILNALVRSGFLYKDEKKRNGGTKYLMRRAPPNLELQGFSMQRCLEDSVEYISREYGKRVCDEWLDGQVTQGNRIVSYDPFGGPDVLLCELK